MQIQNLTKTSIAISMALTLLAAPVLAVPEMQPANVANLHTGQPVATVVVPDIAVGNAESIVPLGFATDAATGKLVQGFAIIHYKNGNARSGGSAKDPTASCYGFISKGARWKVTEPYVVQGHWEFMTSETATGTWTYVYDFDTYAIGQNLNAWDSQVAFDVFGGQDAVNVADSVDTTAPDGKNEVVWGNVSTPGAIAVTIVWGVFGGPLQTRELVEWDLVFDNIDYTWGDATVNPAVMDFENIATHEFGHSAGLADLYQSQCGQQTMYGYASLGETKKRTLETGDISGIRVLYK